MSIEYNDDGGGDGNDDDQEYYPYKIGSQMKLYGDDKTTLTIEGYDGIGCVICSYYVGFGSILKKANFPISDIYMIELQEILPPKTDNQKRLPPRSLLITKQTKI